MKYGKDKGRVGLTYGAIGNLLLQQEKYEEGLEYLQKSGIRLESKDENDLFKILNKFSFRHHRKSQQANYDKTIFYDWTFYVMLSSLYALIKLKLRSEKKS